MSSRNHTHYVSESFCPECADEEEGLWDAAQTGKFLSVSASTVERWRRNRGLPYVRLGRTVRFIPSDVRQWVNARRVEGESDDLAQVV
jgi:excisionase family DNA binding protein